jgi:co-chaperonin GroES (HSP10)
MYDPDVSSGGIIIPDEAKHRCTQGVVKYIGESVRLVSPGDHVLFPAYDGSTVILEGEGTLIFLEESSIQAIITDPIEFVSGLYHKDSDGNYFEATIDSTINSLKVSIQAQEWFKRAQLKRMLQRRVEKSIAAGTLK